MRKIIAAAFTAALMLGGTAWAGDWDVTGAAGGTTVVIDGVDIPAANPDTANIDATAGNATLQIGSGVAATNDQTVTFTSTAAGSATFNAASGATSFTNAVGGAVNFVGEATNKAIVDLGNVATVTNLGTMTFDENTTVTSLGAVFRNADATGTGTINTEAANFAAIAGNLDVTVPTNGFGIINVTAGDIGGQALDWSTATGGSIVTAALQNITADMNLGQGELDLAGGANISAAVTAANVVIGAASNVESGGSLTSALTINAGLTVKAGGTATLSDITVNGGALINQGTMTITGTTFTGATGADLTNTGTLTTTGEALDALGLAADAGNFGTVNLTTAMANDLTVTGATTGTFNVNAAQTGAAIDVGTGDLHIFATDDSNELGILTAGNVVFENGSNTMLNGNVNGAVTLENNAYVEANAAVTFASNAAGQAFNAKAGSEIDASSNAVTISGYDTVALNGLMAVGGANAINNITVTDGAVTVGSDSKFIVDQTVTTGLAPGTVVGGPVLLDATAATSLTYNGPRQVNNIFGQFGLDIDTTNKQVAINSAANNQFAGNWPADATLVTNNLIAANPDSAGLIDSGLAYPIYQDLFQNNVSYAGAAGEYNEEWFNRLAHGATTHGLNKTMLAADVADALLGGMSNIRSVTGMVGVQQANLVAEINSASSSDANATFMLSNNHNNRIWAGYVGSWEDGDRRNGIEGYKYDTNGFIIGYDRIIAERLAAGLAFSYSKGDFEDKAADWNDSDIDNYSLQGYLTWSACNGFFANLFGGYTWSDNEINARYAADYRYADYDSSTWNIGGNLGYSFTWLDRLAVTPTVGLHYIKAKADEHTRFMNGIAQSNIDKASAKALLLPVNINARYDIEFSNCSRLSIEGNVGYSYNFKRDSAIANITMNGVTYTDTGGAVVLRSKGREQSRHTWNFGGGLRYSYNNMDFAVKYDYYTQSDADAHRVMGTVGVSF